MTTSHDDPTIDDLLSDPVPRALMKADRVDPSALDALLRSLAPRLEHRTDRSPSDLRAAVASKFGSQLCGTSLPW